MDIRTSRCVTESGTYQGDYCFSGNEWVRFEHHRRLPSLDSTTYIVSTLPVDFHCHGIDRFDFSEIEQLDFDRIEESLTAEGIRAVPTIYLREESFEPFCEAMDRFAREKAAGRLPSIIGFALEGPVLTSPGGTPLTTIWGPTMAQWQRLAGLGEAGLIYVVLSPDIELGSDAHRFLGPAPLPPSVDWIVETLLEGGVRPALGHFQKSDPEHSAAAVRRLCDLVLRRDSIMVSDHLLNDMPRRIKHAWRTAREQETRLADLTAMNLGDWTLGNLTERLGPVPGALIRGCRDGAIVPCLNFDGEHVDIAISTRLVELLGARNIIGMTDRIESRRLGGRLLEQSTENRLLYQDQGIVAAGTQEIERQVANFMLAGLAAEDAWSLFCFTPARVVDRKRTSPQSIPEAAFFVQPGSPRLPLRTARREPALAW